MAAPLVEPTIRSEEPGAFFKKRLSVLMRTRYFEECAIDQHSYRAIERMRAGPDGKIPKPPPHCRDFWTLKRDFALEYECRKPDNPDACKEYLARKKRLRL